MLPGLTGKDLIMPGRRFLLGFLALLLAIGPVGSYAHTLEHVLSGAGIDFPGIEEGRSKSGVPAAYGEEGGSPQRGYSLGCDLFGAHAPMGAAAPAPSMPAVAPASSATVPAAPSLFRVNANPAPFLQRAPPHDSLMLA
ncbi:hypothetical protein [Pelomicrobium methylotrophicum]|uniref:Uncharacterized protein n=1 Tax=Pelomicrobium methylotrophicum TaxID=2602750 RepID=A0A5C7EZG3_9PROT|nr:hypothetical protein [Pelomicrobium methylotrophicum]TXF13801.1 hypothetical protein FR698_01485 [Pelomicrobium methylotrophicum]